MPRESRIGAWVLVAILGASGPRTAGAGEFAFHHENVMGTSLELKVRADSLEAARGAEGRALAEIDRLARIFSGYDPHSEFSRWLAAPKGPVAVSAELFEILRASDEWRVRTGGAFDPAAEALSRLWARCAAEDREPTAAVIASARAAMAGPAWRLDAGSRTAERRTDVPLTLNAIAKGYIVERACDAAMADGRGIAGLLLNVGGDLRACGDLVGGIGIAAPRTGSETAEPIAYVEVRDRAVATSGSTRRGYRIGGRWRSHILDPRTGQPADAVASASVIAERSADADALATALNVLPPEEGLRLVAGLPGVECLIVAADGRTYRSAGWARYERTPPVLAAAVEPTAPQAGASAAPGQAPWGDAFEMVVNFEINNPDSSGSYRRPYVAVWAEDAKGFPVRTIELWVSLGGAGPSRWLPDLKRWYRSDRVRRQEENYEIVLAIAQPTRPPGRYSVAWDGKDNNGKPVPRGVYTIFIEAAREHGTYQIIRKTVTLADEPFAAVELKGNVEIKSASIEYRRRSPAE